ncbi:MAG: VanZ family protein [Candidatus Omnitrophica bacterium]|nr:VanZ family protein [Candidatus Omnitrophota bacterium]
MKNLLRYWLPVFAYMAFIFYLSSRQEFPMEAPAWMFYADKLVHGTLYAGLGFLFLRALLRGGYSKIPILSVVLAVALASLYGITDEFHQSFVPGRTPDVQDWIADTAGAALVCFLFYAARRLRPANIE